MRRSIPPSPFLPRLRSLDQVAIASGVKTPDGGENRLDNAGPAGIADEQPYRLETHAEAPRRRSAASTKSAFRTVLTRTECRDGTTHFRMGTQRRSRSGTYGPA
jgi:hypothetical protein